MHARENTYTSRSFLFPHAEMGVLILIDNRNRWLTFCMITDGDVPCRSVFSMLLGIVFPHLSCGEWMGVGEKTVQYALNTGSQTSRTKQSIWISFQGST